MLKGYQGITVEWVICLLALFFVLLRLYVRWRMFTPSDWLLIVTWLFHLTGVAFDTSVFAQGLAKDGITLNTQYLLFFEVPLEKLEGALKTMYAGAPIQYMALWGVKITLLLFYYQLVPRHMHLLRWALHSVSALVASSLVVSIFLNLFFCYPVKSNWDVFHPLDLCFSYSEDVPYYTTLGFHVATDVLIYLLPFPLLYNLTLSRKKLYSVIFVFSLGFFCVLCTVARAICVGVGTVSVSMVGMFGALEQGSGIIVACCPALKQLIFGASGDNHITRRRERLARLAPRKGSVTSFWSKSRSRLDSVGHSLNRVALNVLTSSSDKKGDTNVTESKASGLRSEFEWDTDVECGNISVVPKKPEAAKTRKGSSGGRQYDPADRHSRMAGGLAGVPSSTEPLIHTGEGSDQELNIYRNLRNAYDVHLHITK